MTLERWLHALHYQLPTQLRPWEQVLFWLVLVPLSWGYRLALWGRVLCYHLGWRSQINAGVPVISIGNLTTGGVGKTPLTLAVARHLAQAGHRVAILSRGYRATTQPTQNAPLPLATDPAHGDEPYLLTRRLAPWRVPVLVGRDRAANLARLMAQPTPPDVVILDDGFQHWPVARSVDLVLVDGQRGFGNHHLLPAGPLREPREALARASAVLVTSPATPEVLQATKPSRWHNAPRFVLPQPVFTLVRARDWDTGHTEDRPVSPTLLQDQSLTAFCGIGQPQGMLDGLATLGLFPDTFHAFPDHHPYTLPDVEPFYTPGSTWIVLTEKDWVKLAPRLPAPWRERTLVLLREFSLSAEFLDWLKIFLGLSSESNNSY